MLAYLSGPIEYAEDGGRLWRRKLAPYLREQLGHRVYDPAEDEKKNLSEEEAAQFPRVESRRTSNVSVAWCEKSSRSIWTSSKITPTT